MSKLTLVTIFVLDLVLLTSAAQGYRPRTQSLLQRRSVDERGLSSLLETQADTTPTSSGTYYICDILEHKLFIEDPVSTNGCEVAPTCDASTPIADDMIRVFTEANQKGACYEVVGNFSGNPKVKSVEFGAHAEMISFTTTTAVVTLYETTNELTDIAPEATMEVRVLPPTDVRVRVFFQENFEGPYMDILDSTPNTSDYPHIKSAKLGKDFDGIRFYSNNEYDDNTGETWSYTARSIPSLGDGVFGNVHSIKLYEEVNPRHMRIFSNAEYQGTVRDIGGDHDDLGDLRWANSIRSFRLGDEVKYVVLYDGDDYKGDNHAFYTKNLGELPSDINRDANSVDFIYTCSQTLCVRLS